jgi:hypothetical protein
MGLLLHIVELNDMYFPPNIFSGDQIEKNELGGTCSTYGERGGVYRVLLWNPGKETTWKNQVWMGG